MSKICDICQKGYQKGNLVPRGIGRRVTRRTITVRHPNLRSRHFVVNGSMVHLMVCSSCLKRLKYEEKQAKIKAEATVAV
jgi:ribosomal protein L28